MLPMGTVMAGCMLVGAVAVGTASLPSRRDAPPDRLLHAAGIVVGLGGLWNTLWYGLRHVGEFWGHAALGSGLLMLLAAACLLVPGRLPRTLLAIRPLLALGLAGCALLYGVAIYRL